MRVFLVFAFLLLAQVSFAQNISDDNFSEAEVHRILGFLASDSLKGRGDETKELQTAAYFIASEFSRDSLDFYPGFTSYLQPFSLKELPAEEEQKDSAGHFISPKVMFNVVAVLPGKTLPEEAIVFSAHYDHVGVHGSRGDTIYNGANDDASGTTALLMLAHYFAQKKDNARTLIFCAFAAEELGLIGSKVFAAQIKPEKIIAGVNIEMIGRTNAAGKNGIFITGQQYSDFGRIFRKNLKGSGVRIVNEPDEDKQLFRRSDNFSFAEKGIPAHTIMCSDDDEKCYHEPCDEIERIDVHNMVNIIRAIAKGAATLVSGKDTPRRVRRF